MVVYKPFEERTVDTQYRDLLQRILTSGEEVPTRQGVPALRVVGHLMRFPLDNGFPLITERDLVSRPRTRPSPFHQAVAEICAFLNGAQTREELEAFGCYWWADWVTAEECAKFDLSPGDLGPGSYGAAFRRFPTAEGGVFDQVAHLVAQIKTAPHLRHHELTPWIPQYLLQGDGRRRRAVVPPCHGWIHVHVNPGTRSLILSHRQRSADAPVGLVFNLIHYGALALMLGQVTGYRPTELVYFIDDAHIYLNQIKDVEELLSTSPQRLPTVRLDPTVRDLFAFRPEHFAVTDYFPQLPRRRIPTPV
ncbi:MAG: thymidylate synthase [Armatimonadota bacterium]|nr:thymidylate synthase [Armatimonadota bacterium]MDR7451853.1 thymidylate synthase [Armatimonadota bacterium]MDR7467578.1 thymidylate synthase [Armatimonadota bacterium]MDR7494461.1 thymidylate synthase [Armatimonadota bacterium]MDR7499722.1 thymidylate synthase [Armatimonadota bacterium]